MSLAIIQFLRTGRKARFNLAANRNCPGGTMPKGGFEDFAKMRSLPAKSLAESAATEEYWRTARLANTNHAWLSVGL